MVGEVKLVDPRGYGFIVPEDGGQDVFFHCKTVRGCDFESLVPGDRVEYELDSKNDPAKGPRTRTVEPIYARVE